MNYKKKGQVLLYN